MRGENLTDVRLLYYPLRNISTCVEKTSRHPWPAPPWRKHLHMRGENGKYRLFLPSIEETSPHAWRKLPDASSGSSSVRNISTCVEKTSQEYRRRCRTWKHLHMRGENPTRSAMPVNLPETSPHAWRKQRAAVVKILTSGNISTCVEKTLTSRLMLCRRTKHLHMRGENASVLI